MRRTPPSWWYTPEVHAPARLLAPAAWIYGRVAVARYRRSTPYVSHLPVICVGNFTAGGTGKTPLARHIAEMVRSGGRHPVFLTRGYAGMVKGPRLVDPARDTAREVGDEPLLLAQTAPVMIAADRAAGARAIESLGPERSAGVIIMDDGMQNAALAKMLTLAVVDAVWGLGNGRIIPAGPVRAPLDFQSTLADAVVINGDTNAAHHDTMHTPDGFSGPVLNCQTAVLPDTAQRLRSTRVVAFSGLARPEKFFTTLKDCGAEVVATHNLGDHQLPRPRQIARILEDARQLTARIVTTGKDHARLAGLGGEAGRLRDAALVVPIHLTFAQSDAARLQTLIDLALKPGGTARHDPAS